jgi:hypothetical protein
MSVFANSPWISAMWEMRRIFWEAGLLGPECGKEVGPPLLVPDAEDLKRI